MSSGNLFLFFLFLPLSFLENLSYSNILPEHRETAAAVHLLTLLEIP
jgi:hypothetical protein